jgi:hypothetical protein
MSDFLFQNLCGLCALCETKIKLIYNSKSGLIYCSHIFYNLTN